MVMDVNDDISTLKNKLARLSSEIAAARGTECGDTLHDAVKTAEEIIKKDPGDGAVYSDLGYFYFLMRNYSHAFLILSKALSLSGNDVKTINRLAVLKNSIGDFIQSQKLSEKALEIESGNTEAKCNLAISMRYLNHVDAATRIIKELLSVDPNNPMAHYTMAQIHLGNKNFEAGFKEMEWRIKAFPSIRRNILPDIPFWKGEDAADKTLIVNPEREVDMLQFARFVPVALKKVKNIILRVQSTLVNLMAENMPMGVSVVDCQKQVAGDMQIMIMSLPLALKTTPDTLPELVIRPNQKEIEKIKYLFDGKVNKVGFCISRTRESITGSFNENEKRQAFEHALKEAKNRHYTLYSLNSEEYNLENIVDLSSHTYQYDKAAAVIAELDLIISADNGISHLAAAMNKETWVVTKEMAGWRYVDGKQKGVPLWFPNVKVLKTVGGKSLSDFLLDINQRVAKSFR